MHRVTYSKEGLIKFVSHLDLIRLWQRVFRRAGLSVKMTQGFSPHPLISFGPPLPLGVAALREMLDVVFDPGGDLTRANERIQHALPAGVRILDLRPIQESGASISAEIDRATYEAELSGDDVEGAADRVAAAKAAANIVVKKQTAKGERYRDIRPLVHELECGNGSGGIARITFTVGVGETGNLNPYELLEAVLGAPGERVRMIPVTRTALYASGDTSHNRPRGPALKRR
jgi:radical SAM-linked protein